ncbi:hypothetical protein [Paraburkholderia sp. SIMBA_030]|uniref:hypothetical protein n=1 Tax=Paraburkholderia sp. SIMBA_030 TaxID=3085773 RepID=UPI00397B06EB
MNILELAADAGMLVVLDGRIGRTEYRSVHGTLDAFQRFVHALESALANSPIGLSVERGLATLVQFFDVLTCDDQLATQQFITMRLVAIARHSYDPRARTALSQNHPKLGRKRPWQPDWS